MLFFLCHNKSSYGFLDHYRKKRRESRVRLCGIDKKYVLGAVNLHKLSCKCPEAATNQSCAVRKCYLFGKDPLFPVVQEGTDDMAAVAFINGWVVIRKIFKTFSFLMGRNDFNVFVQGNL